MSSAIAIWLAAYLAAGTFYVLRGLGAEGARSGRGEWNGLAFVALCWLPISMANLISLQRTQTWRAALAQFLLETDAPLALLLAIVAVGGSS